MKVKNILFSVIIPTFNNSRFLKLAIESVLSQTYTNFEILIINNNSTDDTSRIISSFNDFRISEFKINNSGVIAKSRNMGIRLSKGEWICFLDSDDKWYKSRLETILKNIQKYFKFDVFTTNEFKTFINSSKKKKLFYGPLLSNKYKSLLLYGNRLSTSATVVRKDFLKKNKILFDETISYITVEDYDLWLKLALRNAKFKFINKFEGEYLIHNNNSSGKFELHNNNLNNLLKNHVYKIQEFSTNKNKLWTNIYSCREFIKLIKSKNILKINNIQEILIVFFKAPFFIIKYICIRIGHEIFNQMHNKLFIK